MGKYLKKIRTYRLEIFWWTVIIVGWVSIISASWYYSWKKNEADLALISELHMSNGLIIKLIEEMQEERKFYGLYKDERGRNYSDLRDGGMHLQSDGQEGTRDESVLETEHSNPE